MLKDAIQQVTDMNPDMSVQKIEIRTNTETWANDTHLAQSLPVVAGTCTMSLLPG